MGKLSQADTMSREHRFSAVPRDQDRSRSFFWLPLASMRVFAAGIELALDAGGSAPALGALNSVELLPVNETGAASAFV